MLCEFLRIVNRSNITRARCLIQKNKPIVVCINNLRFYSKQKDSSCSSNKERKVNKICISARKVPIQTCKPEQHKPCPSCPDKTRACKVPYQERVGTNLDCPWEEVDQTKKYKKYALWSILIAATTLAYIAYSTNKSKLDEKDTSKKIVAGGRQRKTCKIPASGKQFPTHVPYLLIGGGTASFAAFRAIKSTDPKAKVLVISNECYYPYMRPPLSKELWFTDNEQKVDKLVFKQWNGSERSLFYEPVDFYTEVNQLDSKENGGVAVALGWNISKIDVVNHIAYLDDNTPVEYEKCLVATGTKPKNLEIFKDVKPQIKDRVTVFRDVFDFQKLNDICKEDTTLAIIGGGFLGSELACAIGRKGKQNGVCVYQIFKEEGNMDKILPEYLSAWTTKKVMDEGVQVIPKAEVEDAEIKKDQDDNDKIVLHLSNGKKLYVDHVVVAIGVEPNTELAETSDLEVDEELGGFLVNTEMEARSNLYVAGDCSCFYDTKLGRRRVEHHDHAVVSGRLAGENMAGGNKPYLHQSMFWSDLGPDVGYEAIGIIDASLPTVGVFAKTCPEDDPDCKKENNIHDSNKTEENHDTSNKDFSKGVIFYLKDNTVVGIILWNVFNRMSVARQVLKDQKKYDDLNEVAKLFNIHDVEPEQSVAASSNN